MRAAVIAVNERGAWRSAEIADLGVCSCVRFVYEKYADAAAIPFDSVYDVTGKLFREYDALLFLCAAGIAVRAIAPHIRDKSTDPAVLVLDDAGKYVVPILSGHIGGANALAEEFAAKLGAIPVLTTATDSGGEFSPDCFAKANFLRITDLSAAKEVAAAVLRGEPVGLESDYPYGNCPPELHPGENCRVGLYIGDNASKKPFPVTLRLLPCDLILGIGCRKGASAAQIAKCVADSGIPIERVQFVTTIDRKANEPGLIAFCKEYRLKLHCYTAQALMQARGDFTASAFVQKTVGADNVCERSCVLGADGALVFRKFAENGVTCAAAKCKMSLDFAKRRDLT